MINFDIEPLTFEDYHSKKSINKEKKEHCNDCGQLGKLIEKPCCAHYISLGSICCGKMVCQVYCSYNCPSGHTNFVKNKKGWMDEIKCAKCEQKWQPKFCWWGRPPYE